PPDGDADSPEAGRLEPAARPGPESKARPAAVRRLLAGCRPHPRAEGRAGFGNTRPPARPGQVPGWRRPSAVCPDAGLAAGPEPARRTEAARRLAATGPAGPADGGDHVRR